LQGTRKNKQYQRIEDAISLIVVYNIPAFSSSSPLY